MTENTKVSLLGDIKLGELVFDSKQFDIPTELYIDFVDVKPTYIYKDRNKTDEIAKYVLKGIDVNVVRALESVGADISQVNGIVIEVVKDFDTVADLVDSNYIGLVKFINPVVKPLWVTMGQSGSFKKLKLVVDGVSKITTTTSESSKA
ncbi:hypothetical protein OZX68_03395 [Streptococcaceae bacterium ESL0729]|nr:hypothetical protein OZX68_03395 [Streptococcaceae bacterium ESL0729]